NRDGYLVFHDGNLFQHRGRVVMHTQALPQAKQPRTLWCDRKKLSIIDGIEGMAGGEGGWVSAARHIKPGVLVAGLNPVSTDAVGAALMGFDPMAGHRQMPFEGCDSTLLLAEQQGLGTRDLGRVEIAGVSVAAARIDFRSFSPGPWRRVRPESQTAR
ncbi:MAG TPA: DUF362 domain-containing protein, partial [Bryobacteraceae bacterium]|nr:DUF362 domain-containing protein [Bryobacteraceae bacterium]